MPPEGKLLASGSLWINCAPLKRSIGIPSSSKVRKASCFSAVRPVCGWNQWQKWVAPFSSAHSFTACATSFAIAGSSLAPRRMVSCSDWKMGLGSFCFMAATLNVLAPNTSRTRVPPASSGTDRMLREVTSRIAHCRPDPEPMIHPLYLGGALRATHNDSALATPPEPPSFGAPDGARLSLSGGGLWATPADQSILDCDGVLDLHHPAGYGHGLDAEGRLLEDRPAGRRQQVARELYAHGQDDRPAHPVQRELACDLQLVDPWRDPLALDRARAKDDLRIARRVQHPGADHHG